MQRVVRDDVKYGWLVSFAQLAAIVKACRDLPGYELFQYVDDNGTRQAID